MGKYGENNGKKQENEEPLQRVLVVKEFNGGYFDVK